MKSKIYKLICVNCDISDEFTIPSGWIIMNTQGIYCPTCNFKYHNPKDRPKDWIDK